MTINCYMILRTSVLVTFKNVFLKLHIHKNLNPLNLIQISNPTSTKLYLY